MKFWTRTGWAVIGSTFAMIAAPASATHIFVGPDAQNTDLTTTGAFTEDSDEFFLNITYTVQHTGALTDNPFIAFAIDFSTEGLVFNLADAGADGIDRPTWTGAVVTKTEWDEGFVFGPGNDLNTANYEDEQGFDFAFFFGEDAEQVALYWIDSDELDFSDAVLPGDPAKDGFFVTEGLGRSNLAAFCSDGALCASTLASSNNVPAPGMIGMLGLAVVLTGAAARRRK